MEIKVQISDKAYGRLMSSGSRIQGTIGLVSPTEGNFNYCCPLKVSKR